MRKLCLRAALAWILSSGGMTFSADGPDAPPSSLNSSQAQCKAIAGEDFSSVEDAATQLTNATLVETTGRVPSYCDIQGYVNPQVGFDLRLPAKNWNHATSI